MWSVDIKMLTWLIVKSPNAEFDTDMLKVIVFSVHGYRVLHFSCFVVRAHVWIFRFVHDDSQNVQVSRLDLWYIFNISRWHRP